jgi:hypothetical protein
MYHRLRWKDVKAACAAVSGYCEDDPRLLSLANEAQEMLLYSGKWLGTVQNFRFCVPSSACITFPREIETIEALAVCKQPFTIRSGWYEFLENGFGEIAEGDNLCSTLIDRGEAPAFDEVTGSNKKLAIYADKDGNTGKYVTLQFVDQYGNRVRTNFNGAEIEGEKLAIGAKGTYVYSTNVCLAGGLYAVQKDRTVGVIRLYSYDTTTAELKPLAYYQPDEEVPSYRQSLIPSLVDNTCSQTPVTVRAKLRFIPATGDDSWMLISNARAIRLAVQAMKKERDELLDMAGQFSGRAMGALDQQVAHHQGSGEKANVQMDPPSIWGGGIPNVI